MYKIYTTHGIIETESYEEVLIHQKQGCAVLPDVDLKEIDEAFDVKEFKVLGEAFPVNIEDYEL